MSNPMMNDPYRSTAGIAARPPEPPQATIHSTLDVVDKQLSDALGRGYSMLGRVAVSEPMPNGKPAEIGGAISAKAGQLLQKVNELLTVLERIDTAIGG